MSLWTCSSIINTLLGYNQDFLFLRDDKNCTFCSSTLIGQPSQSIVQLFMLLWFRFLMSFLFCQTFCVKHFVVG